MQHEISTYMSSFYSKIYISYICFTYNAYLLFWKKFGHIYIYTKYVWTFNEYADILFISKSWDEIVWVVTPGPTFKTKQKQFWEAVY